LSTSFALEEGDILFFLIRFYGLKVENKEPLLLEKFGKRNQHLTFVKDGIRCWYAPQHYDLYS